MGLFNRAFAKRHGGQFLLRIEDTDQVRSRPEYERHILDSLRWAGLTWDEGPDVGGPHAPYRQSERSAIYAEHAKLLIERGAAYRCFCTPERLEEMRRDQLRFKQPPRYDQTCRRLPAPEVAARLAAGTVHTVRLKIPAAGECVLQDKLRGTVKFAWAEIDDQVLMKSDGLPTYHLANVVDDHLMGITHVIRGEEWLNSCPKHVLLYEGFGWEPPEWYHMPLLLNPDGTKLSKRKNPTSILYYKEAGFLPEALCNYLCQMGYSRPDQNEKFTYAEFEGDVDLGRISLGGSVFDRQKLLQLNGRYIRESFSSEDLLARLAGWKLSPAYFAEVLPLMKSRMETLGDFLTPAVFLFAREVRPAPADLVPPGKTPADGAAMLQTLLYALEEGEAFSRDAIEAAFKKATAFWDVKIRVLTGLGFVAITGGKVGPPLYESMALLGRDMCRTRLMAAIEAAGGLSRKALDELEKRWKAGPPAPAAAPAPPPAAP